MPLVYAQQPTLKFEQISTDDGLSRANIKAFTQDKYGFIWIGTGYGLNRYNGYDFQVFLHDPEDSSSISSNEVRSLLSGEDGSLWIGTRSGGLNRYDYTTNTFERIGAPTKDELGEDEIDHIMQDPSGEIWVSSTNGIIRYNPRSRKLSRIYANPTAPNALPNRYVKQIYQDTKQNYWVAHDLGISQMHIISEDSVYFDNYLYEEGRENWLPKQYVKKIIEDFEGNLWVATDGGMATFDRQRKEFQTFAHNPDNNCSISNNYVKDIAIDANGHLWVGADAGISIFDPATQCFANHSNNPNDPQSLSNNYVKAIFKDRAGAMWVGTDAGINRYDAQQYPFPTLYAYDANAAKSLSSSCVYDIAAATDDWVWVATSKGINKLNSATGEIKNYPQTELPSEAIKTLLKDQQGRLWAGSDNGLCLLLNETRDKLYFKVYQNDPSDSTSLSNNSVVSLAEDKDGYLWVGTWGDGLSRYSPQTDRFEQMTKTQSINGISMFNNQVQYLMIDDHNTLWVGNTSLDTLNLDSWESGSFKANSGMNKWVSESNNLSIYKGASGYVWLGTTNGLIQYQPSSQEITHYSTKDGLQSNIIQSIIETEDGKLWIGTDKGLSLFDPVSKVAHNFDGSDGLQTAEFNINAVYRNQKGDLFFGGLKGLNIFNPDQLQLNQTKPPVYITGLFLKNKPVTPQNSDLLEKPVSETKKITLSHDATFLRLEFVAINYRSPDKNQYAYRLKGLQDSWVYTPSSRRDASFSSLPPGKYKFQVKASNNDGLWNDEGTSIDIVVTPPWWDTRMAKSIFAMSIVIGIYVFIRIRTRMFEAQKQELETLVAKRTEALSKANESLQERQEEVLVQNEELQQQAEEIAAQRDRINEQHVALSSSYKDMKIVSEVGKDITSSFSIENIFEEVYKDVNLIMDAPTFGIGIYKEASNTLDFMEIDGKDATITTSSDSLEKKTLLSIKCFLTGESTIIRHFSQEFPSYRPANDSNLINESVVYLPLQSKDKRLGVITVQSLTPKAYSEQHITMLEILASYTATALDNSQAYDIIQGKNKLITDSIRYAQTIQQAILPTEEKLSEAFEEYFVIFKPKDIVSGDFYWHLTVQDGGSPVHYIACVDCTGHGVPGAFMSMIASRILTEVLIEKGLREPSEILELLDKSVRVALKQGEGRRSEAGNDTNSDGMDLSLCCLKSLNSSEYKMLFSAAKGELLYTTQAGKINRLKGNRRSIGGIQLQKEPFTTQEALLPKGSTLYLSSDGLVDQHGPNRKKYGRMRLITLLESIQGQPLSSQMEEIEQSLKDHQQHMEQRDDITFIGIKL